MENLGVIKIEVMGEDHKLNLGDMLDDPAAKNKWVYKISLLHANAVYQEALLDAEYKAERSAYFSRAMKRDPKLAEWKIRNRFAGSEVYAKYQQGLAQCRQTALHIIGILDALKIK